MRGQKEIVSQRLLRKGALVEESYRIFTAWDFQQGVIQNLSRNTDQFKTMAWAREVISTLNRRFQDIEMVRPLIVAAKMGLPLDEWRTLLLLWIGSREHLYRRFAFEWLYPEYDSGRQFIKPEDLRTFVQSMWKNIKPDKPLSDYGLIRTCRDLLRMAKELGVIVSEGSTCRFNSAQLSDRCFLYFAHVITEEEGSSSKILKSDLWKLVLMRAEDVERDLLRLHQFKKLEYQVAGSLVQLILPCASSHDYAERMVA